MTDGCFLPTLHNSLDCRLYQTRAEPNLTASLSTPAPSRTSVAPPTVEPAPSGSQVSARPATQNVEVLGGGVYEKLVVFGSFSIHNLLL